MTDFDASEFHKPSRSEALKATRKRQLDDLFSGKRFTIESEVHLPPGEVYQTPLGHKGRHGWIVVQEDSPETKYVVGYNLLKIMAKEYAAVDLPLKRKK